jgi:hypothetical protein
VYARLLTLMPVVFTYFTGNIGIQLLFFGQAPFAVCSAGNNAD